MTARRSPKARSAVHAVQDGEYRGRRRKSPHLNE